MKTHMKTITTKTFTLSSEEVQAILIKHLGIGDAATTETRFLSHYGTAQDVGRVRLVTTFNEAEANEET